MNNNIIKLFASLPKAKYDINKNYKVLAFDESANPNLKLVVLDLKDVLEYIFINKPTSSIKPIKKKELTKNKTLNKLSLANKQKKTTRKSTRK